MVGLVRLPEIKVCEVPAAPPVIPLAAGADHVYVVPAGTIPSVPFAGEVVNADPLQLVFTSVLIAGTGLTVTVTVNVLFAPQLGEFGVTI